MYINLEDCSCTCEYCGALFWLNERYRNKNTPKFFLCYKNGEIQLPLIQQSPEALNTLLNYHGGPLSTFFRKNIWTFNLMFAFTSFRVNINSSAKNSHGLHIFKISGQIYHLMEYLLPIDDNPPKFAQLYIYNT